MKRFDQINVIPFIDIMLVLLAIVLTTASFIAQGKIPVELPSAESATALEATRALEIAIDHEGSIYLDGEAIHMDALKQHLSSLPVDTKIVLRIDRTAPFGLFVSVMDKLNKLGMDEVTIVARQDKR